MSGSSRPLRSNSTKPTPPSSAALYPNLPGGTSSSQDRAIPSIEEDQEEKDLEPVEETDELERTAMAEAISRQFAAWAKANPALAMATMSGQQPSPPPVTSPSLAMPLRQSTVDSSVSKRKEFPHPPVFEGDMDAWIPFRNKMTTKLRRDRDLYPETEQRLDYWASRLGDKPSRELEPYYNEHGELRMESEHELIDLLNLLYVNSNQKNDELAEFEQLRMKHTDKFIDFFIVFWRLAKSIGFANPKAGLPFQFVQHELLRRLPRRLRDHQVYVNIEFTTIEALRNYYIRLDNYWHQTEQLNKTSRPAASGVATNTALGRVVHPALVTVPSTSKAAIVPATVRATPAPQAAVPTPSSCYTCGSSGHFAKDCPSGRKVRFTPRASATPGQVAELHQEQDIVDEVDSGEESLPLASENE